MNEMNIECWLDSFVIFRRSSWTSIAKKPYKFVIFQGGGWGSGPTAPSLDPRMSSHVLIAFANSSGLILVQTVGHSEGFP